jgi:hypothetical protein
MKLTVAATLVIALALGCSRKPQGLEIAAGTEVTIQKKDGVTISGKLVEVQAERVVLESRAGTRTQVPRSEITSVSAAATPTMQTGSASPSDVSRATAPARERGVPPNAPPAPSAPSVAPDASPKPADSAPAYRDVTIPAGTVLPVTLRTAVASDSSRVEDPVRGSLARSVRVDGVEVLPAGTVVTGHVTEASRSARVKGRARIAFRFNQLDTPGEGGHLSIRTGVVARQAVATRKRDAAKIGGGAAGGAIIGGILGGGEGAAKGAAIGGAAGTGVVLSTRGKEVRLAPGAALSIKLLEPVTVRMKR